MIMSLCKDRQHKIYQWKNSKVSQEDKDNLTKIHEKPKIKNLNCIKFRVPLSHIMVEKKCLLMIKNIKALMNNNLRIK